MVLLSNFITSAGSVGIIVIHVRLDVNGDVNVAGVATATSLFEGTTRVATTGKAIAMAPLIIINTETKEHGLHRT